MRKIMFYITFIICFIIVLPSLLITIGGGIKKLALDDFKKTYNMGQTTIKVYITQEKRTVEMNVEDYVKGVVAAELPNYFELEAMKAQAVAARTYALARKSGLYRTQDNVHNDADVCTDVHCQVWTSKDAAFERWGNDAEKIWQKIDTAVLETSGLVITFNDKMINPLYHSNSGGMTENVADVWNTEEVPYLTAVASAGEEAYGSEYNGSLTITNSDFINKIKAFNKSAILSDKDPYKDIKIGLRTASGRVNDIKIGNVSMKGTEFRTLFVLKSTNFTIERAKNNSILITTIGNGHGVGMSQCGANIMASEGKNYSDILTYYYEGTKITDYKSVKNNY